MRVYRVILWQSLPIFLAVGPLPTRADCIRARAPQPRDRMFGRGGFYGGYGGFGGFDDDSLERGDWSEKSGAASRREEEARAAFKEVHGKTTASPPAAATTYELLKPSTHLTQPCWRDVKKYIVSHAGWSAKRRQATEAEKRQHGEKRQSAVYFVDVTFTPPKNKGATSAGKKVTKVDKAAKEEARAQMSSSMSSWVAGAKRPAETATGDLSEEEEVEMAPKRKKAVEVEEEEDEAPPSGQLKTKRWSVQLKRLKGSMGLGIDEQYYVTAVKEGGAAATEGSIEIGDHILEINGVETGTLSKPIPKILPTHPNAPVKVRLARYSAETSAAEGVKAEEGVKKPRAATKGAATKGAATKGFEIRYSRSSSVVEWDDGTFTDCRPSEAEDTMEEHEAAATCHDVANASMHQMAQQGGLPKKLVAKLPQRTFETAAEANEAAKAFMEMVLAHERTSDRGRGLTAPRDDVDAEWSSGFEVPKTSEAPELLTTVEGCSTYAAKVTLFCDVHGADVHNVVVAALKASVVPA